MTQITSIQQTQPEDQTSTGEDPLPRESRQLNLAYLINLYPKVSHTFVRREILELERRGHTIHRYTVRSSGENLVDPADLEEKRKTHIILADGHVPILLSSIIIFFTRPRRFLRTLQLAIRIGRKSDRGITRNLIYLAEACHLVRLFRRVQVQHVHAHFSTNPAALVMLCRNLGGPPYSFTVHGPGVFDRATLLALDHKIAHAEFVVAITDYCRSQLFRWSSSDDWPKIQIVHCALDADYLDQQPQPITETSNLVCVGRLCPEKGQLLLVDAAAQLAAANVDFHLALVGDGEMRPQIEQRIAQHNLADRITITGWASGDEVRKHLLAARAMVLPSFAEGLPVVIMEAMALARPVISTYIAGIPELVQPDCGCLIPAGNVDQLAQAMRRILAMPLDDLNNMGRQARARTLKQHDIRIEARKIEQHILRSLDAH